ncbi:MAG: IS630 family transposase [Terriglobia bacterium]
MDITGEERTELEAAISVGYDGSLSARAQMILWHADGCNFAEIARRAGTTKPTAALWIGRYEQGGIGALEDRLPTGRPPSVSAQVRSRIIALTRSGPPEKTGLTHWSSREMAKYLKRNEGISVSHNFISELWLEKDLRPHRQGTFKVSRDPDFATKVVDIIGLYLDPPTGAVVLSFDEKTQVQALSRTQPMLPVDFGKTEKRTHDYKRHGTTNLFAALDIITGAVKGRCFDRRRTVEFLKFMTSVVREYPSSQEIHVILDNLSTHNNAKVDEWLEKRPSVKFHFTPKGASWINQIETFFGVITRQAIRRGDFRSVAHLVKKIGDYIEHWNEDARPFEWSATASEILGKVAILDRDYKKLVANNVQ